MKLKSFYPPVSIKGPVSNRYYIILDGIWNPVDRLYNWDELEKMWEKISYSKPKEVIKTAKKEWKVKGSKSNVYSVVNDNGYWSCSCPAHSFRRGDCKHIKQIKDESKGTKIHTMGKKKV